MLCEVCKQRQAVMHMVAIIGCLLYTSDAADE